MNRQSNEVIITYLTKAKYLGPNLFGTALSCFKFKLKYTKHTEFLEEERRKIAYEFNALPVYKYCTPILSAFFHCVFIVHGQPEIPILNGIYWVHSIAEFEKAFHQHVMTFFCKRGCSISRLLAREYIGFCYPTKQWVEIIFGGAFTYFHSQPIPWLKRKRHSLTFY